LIAYVTITTLRTDVSPGKRYTHHLVAEFEELLKGEYEGELALTAVDNTLGFESVERERTNLLRRPMVLFAKWERDSAGTVRARWHLARRTPDLERTLEKQLARTTPDSHRIIRHTH